MTSNLRPSKSATRIIAAVLTALIMLGAHTQPSYGNHAGPVENVNCIQPLPPVRLSGVVKERGTGRAVAFASVELWQLRYSGGDSGFQYTDAHFVRRALTEPDGHFVLNAHPGGGYILLFFPTLESIGFDARAHVDNFAWQDKNKITMVSINLSNGQHTQIPDVLVTAHTHAIEGRVVEHHTAAPQPNVRIHRVARPYRASDFDIGTLRDPGAVSGADGYFKISVANQGAHLLEVEPWGLPYGKRSGYSGFANLETTNGAPSTTQLFRVSDYDTSYTFSGRVVDADTNQPLTTTQIMLTDDEGQYVKTNPDTEGRWRITVPNAFYNDVSVVAQPSGVDHFEYQRLRNTFSLKDGELNYVFDARLKRVSVVTGRIVSQSGRATAGVEIELRDEAGYPISQTVTDAAGRYRLLTNGAGRYKIGIPQQSLTTGANGAVIVIDAEPRNHVQPDLALPIRTHIRVAARFANSTLPAPSLGWRATATRALEQWNQNGTLDLAGHTRLIAVQTGPVTITIDGVQQSATIDGLLDEVIDLSFDIPIPSDEAVIHGRLVESGTDMPVQYVRVAVNSDPYGSTTTTDALGHYVLRFKRQPDTALVVEGGGRIDFSDASFARSYFPGALSPAAATRFSAQAGEIIHAPDWPVTRSGEPLRVNVWPTFQPHELPPIDALRSAQIDIFTVDGTEIYSGPAQLQPLLPPGNYKVRAHAPLHDFRFYPNALTLADAQSITVPIERPDMELPDINMVVQPCSAWRNRALLPVLSRVLR
jgi:hypothetical protein